MSLSFNTSYLTKYINAHELQQIEPQVAVAHEYLHKRNGAGNQFLGWLDLPVNYDTDEFSKIKKAAGKIRSSCDVFIVIGVGGSYLGTRAAIEFLRSSHHNQLAKKNGSPEVYFVGNSFSSDYLTNILTLCKDKDVCVNVISKSGTTTEPALAFRIIREYLEEKYGSTEAAKRIYCTTDKSQGTLKNLADLAGCETFVIPDNVGGRFSVLTPVGLLPIAVAGCDIDRLLAGAAFAYEQYKNPNLMENDCYQYAAIRNILNRKGKSIEILVAYEPCFTLLGEWFKQLFGESEGKDGKGIYPSTLIYSTDLHSLGQYVQDGTRNIFETVVHIENSKSNLKITDCPSNYDGLNYLSGMTYPEVCFKSLEATVLAHTDGGVPNTIISLPNRDEYCLGQLFYFFEKACAVSAYILGVNPFNQTGVEEYKTNMFALLGKPGYENLKKELEKEL